VRNIAYGTRTYSWDVVLISKYSQVYVAAAREHPRGKRPKGVHVHVSVPSLEAGLQGILYVFYFILTQLTMVLSWQDALHSQVFG
jgi:hypothetical protein